jgi:hypothetical protein
MAIKLTKRVPYAAAAAFCLFSAAHLCAQATPSTFVAITPCRVVDTRNATGDLGGPILLAGTRDFPILSGSCNIPNTAVAYSLNVTAIPTTHLSYLTIYATGQDQPATSTLNDDTGTIVANEVTVSAGTSGSVTVYVTDETNVVLDIDGYFIPDTSVTFQGAWSNSATYAQNAAVSYNGSSYISLIASNTGNEPDTSTSQWSVLAQPGATGPTGATGAAGPPGPVGPQGDTGATGPQGAQGDPGPSGMTFQGVWSNSHAYALNDVVYYNGTSYINLYSVNTGQEPDISPVTWAPLALRGPTGPTGATGAQGPTGLQGPTGNAGAAGSNGTNGTNGPIVFTASADFDGTQYQDFIGLSGANQSAAANPAGTAGMPGRACSSETMRVGLGFTPSSSVSPVLYQNGTPSTLTCTISTSSSSCSVTQSLPILATDYLAFYLYNGTNIGNAFISMTCN